MLYCFYESKHEMCPAEKACCRKRRRMCFMKDRRRIVAGLLSGVLAVSGVAKLPVAVAEDGCTGSYDMQIAVKLDGTR